MIYLEAPKNLKTYKLEEMRYTIFLAGSITGARNWQKDATKKLLPHFNIFNPRRENYDSLVEGLEKEQISWEFRHLALADIVIFYFSNETLAPITLFEYGKRLAQIKYAPYKKTYVAIHPEYKRKNDVIIQTELENPELLKNLFLDLDEMLEFVIKQNP